MGIFPAVPGVQSAGEPPGGRTLLPRAHSAPRVRCVILPPDRARRLRRHRAARGYKGHLLLSLHIWTTKLCTGRFRCCSRMIMPAIWRTVRGAVKEPLWSMLAALSGIKKAAKGAASDVERTGMDVDRGQRLYITQKAADSSQPGLLTQCCAQNTIAPGATTAGQPFARVQPCLLLSFTRGCKVAGL